MGSEDADEGHWYIAGVVYYARPGLLSSLESRWVVLGKAASNTEIYTLCSHCQMYD